MHPVKEGDEDDDEEEAKRQHVEHYHMHTPHADMHMHAGVPPAMQMQHPQHDPRHHGYYPAHMYGQPAYGHYDYSQHHQRGARGQGYGQGYPAPRHPYEGGM